MRKLVLILLLAISGLFAAELRDGVLYLQVNLVSGTSIDLDCIDGKVEIQDESKLFRMELSGPFTISILNPESTTLYGVLAHGKCSEAESEAVVRKSFAWVDSNLVLQHELQYFHPQSFHDLASARSFALEHGYPYSSIQAIPIVNSTVLIRTNKGEEYYFESPLKLNCQGQLLVMGLPYVGEFELTGAEGKLWLNQVVALEEYIAGVLPNEIGTASPIEALKAQAVAARTHAVSLLLYNRHRDQGFDLCSSTHCQVYKGKHLRNNEIEEAVIQTAGEILIVEHRVADATYHSSCGGKTDSSARVWKGAEIPHLSGSTCYPEADSYDLSSEEGAYAWLTYQPDTSIMSSWERAGIAWNRSISRAKLAANVGLKSISSIQILERGRSGRILKLKLCGERDLILDSEFRIRQAFGNLPSSFFVIRGMKGKSMMQLAATIHLEGRGSGHGVGMCQVGTLRKARQGMSYQDILSLYYPGTTITTEWTEYEE